MHLNKWRVWSRIDQKRMIFETVLPHPRPTCHSCCRGRDRLLDLLFAEDEEACLLSMNTELCPFQPSRASLSTKDLHCEPLSVLQRSSPCADNTFCDGKAGHPKKRSRLSARVMMFTHVNDRGTDVSNLQRKPPQPHSWCSTDAVREVLC